LKKIVTCNPQSSLDLNPPNLERIEETVSPPSPMEIIPPGLDKSPASDTRTVMPQDPGPTLSRKKLFLTGGIFYLLFLLPIPLGLFNDWIPPLCWRIIEPPWRFWKDSMKPSRC